MSKLTPSMILIILILITSKASSEYHPPGYGELCFHCHGLLLTPGEYYSKFGTCTCHDVYDIWYDRNKIDMRKLSKLHGIEPCIRCHVGKLELKSFHTTHRGVDCLKCHEKYIRPSKNCYDCHKGGIHEIHENLREICTACHGKVVYKLVSLKEVKEIMENRTVEERKPWISKFSLYDLIKKIISFIGL